MEWTVAKLKEEVEKLFNSVQQYSDVIKDMRSKIMIALNYQEAIKVLDLALAMGFIAKDCYDQVVVRLISGRSFYNSRIVSSSINFDSCESQISETSCKALSIILTELKQRVELKSKELYDTKTESIEELCLKQVQFEGKLEKFYNWFINICSSNNTAVDWENSLGRSYSSFMYRDEVYEQSQTTILETVLSILERELSAINSQDFTVKENSAIGNSWTDKTKSPIIAFNIISFIEYLEQ